MKYSWLTMFQMHSKVIQLYKHTYIIFEIIFHHRLLQDIHHSSLCYTVNFCCLLHYLFFRLFVTPWTVDHQSLSLRPHGLLPARLLCPGRFSRQEYWGSSQPRDWTQVFHTAGRFFNSWATRETLYAEYVLWNAGLDKAQAGIKTAGRNINNLRYAGDTTTLMAKSKEELKSLLIKVKGEWKSWVKSQHSEN